MASLPKTIRAIHQPDPKSTNLILTTTPLPTISSTATTDYLIRVKAASPCLNELSWEANFPDLFPKERERVPCTECAGVVAAGPPNGKFKPGDDVFYRAAPLYTGNLREYSVAAESTMAHKPKALSWTAAAATPLSSLTAWQGLFEHGGLDPAAIVSADAAARKRNAARRVLITGAGGGVGSWAVQFAAAAGAGAIVAVCGPSKAADVRAFGATEIVDYTVQPLDAWAREDPAAREVDLVLDCVGGATTRQSWAAVRDGGVILSIVGQPAASKPDGETKTLAKGEWFLVEPRGSDLAEIAKLIDAGKMTPLIDSVLPLEKFAEAFDRVQGGKTKGKVVIQVEA